MEGSVSTSKKVAKKTAKKPAKKTAKSTKPVVTVQVQGGDPVKKSAATAGELKEIMKLGDEYIMTINGRAVRRPSDELKTGNFVSFTTKSKHGN
jgi:hypothetical protein